MDKFIMPAEWETHEAVWLAWPYDKDTFPNRVEKVEKVYCNMIKALEGSERIYLLASPLMKNQVEEILKHNKIDLKQIVFHLIDYADVWIRDYGPIFLINRKEKKIGWVKSRYNAYGKRDDSYYAPLLKDEEVFKILAPIGQKFNLDIVLEGGIIEDDGDGVLLTME